MRIVQFYNSKRNSDCASSSAPGVGSAINVTLVNVGFLASLALGIVIISSSVPHSVVLAVFGVGGGRLAVQ